MIAGAYIRKSNVEKQVAAELKSVAQQLDDLHRVAASHGWTLDDRYIFGPIPYQCS